MRILPALACFALLVLVGASTVAASASAPPDRSLYPGSERLSDDELRTFLQLLGDRFPPGTRIPLWATRFVERFRAVFASLPDGGPRKPPVAEVTVGPNVNVSSDPTRIHSESFVAVDRSNPLRLIGGANQINDNPQALFGSADGGATWAAVPMALGNATFHSDPGVAWDSTGTGYASALGIDATGKFTVEVQVVKTLDGGQSWSAVPDVVSSDSGNDKELIAANDQPGSFNCPDLVCVAWDQIKGASSPVHVACAPGGNPPWTDVVVGTGALIGAVPAFGPDGSVHVAWSNIGANRIESASSTDCGRTWSPNAPIATTRVGYDLGIPAMCSRRALVYPAIDVDRTRGPRGGWVYVVWTDASPGSSCPANSPNPCDTSVPCTSNVYFSRSRDFGTLWDPPTVVHTDLPATDQFNPWLAVDDSDGSVHVMWYDTRNDPARAKTDVFHRSSLDGGTTWEPETRVTTAMTDETGGGADLGNQYGDYNGLAAFQCRSFPIWTDRRSGGFEQIYTAEVDAAPAPPPDLGNALRLVFDPARAPLLSWTDLGGSEVDYRVYRGDAPDFVLLPPLSIGTSGGADAVTLVDPASPATPGVAFYKVRGLGPCGAELATW